MELITKRKKIKTVTERWKKQYWNGSFWLPISFGDSQIIYEKLTYLDLDSCKEQDVIDIIGNDSWTCVICDNCKKDCENAVVFNFNHENIICLDCIEKSRKLMLKEIRKRKINKLNENR